MSSCAFVNGVIHTLDGERSVWQAMYVEEGVIRRLGTSQEISPMSGQVIDLGGRTVIPGFHDTHLHLLSYGMAINSLDGKDCTTKEAVLAQAKARLSRHPVPALWLGGFVSPYEFTKEDLDCVSTDIPVFYSRVNGHTYIPKANLMSKVCCNSTALSLAGITSTTSVENGTILAGEQGLTGLLKGMAVGLISHLLPWPSRAERKAALATATSRLAAYGFSAVHSNDLEFGDTELLELFQELAQEGKLPLRVYMQCLFEDPLSLRKFLTPDPRLTFQTDRHKISALKLILDGTLGDRSAALTQGYLDSPDNCGTLLYSQPQLEALIAEAHAHHLPVVMHAIGTQAIRQGLDALAAEERRHGRQDFYDGLVHCLLTEPASFSAMAKLKVAALVQPLCLAGDFPGLPSRIPDALIATSYAWKSMLEHGILVSGGTDCPCDSPNPFESLFCAVTRQDLTGTPPGGFLPQQRLSLEDALSVMTVNGAQFAGDASSLGSLEPGKFADFILLSQDIFSLPAQELAQVRCVATVSGGNLVYAEEGIL